MKTIFTFGSNQLQEFDVNPMSVMLVIDMDTERGARAFVMSTEIGDKFCNSYPYEKYAGEFKEKYGMVEYTIHELFQKERR